MDKLSTCLKNYKTNVFVGIGIDSKFKFNKFDLINLDQTPLFFSLDVFILYVSYMICPCISSSFCSSKYYLITFLFIMYRVKFTSVSLNK